MFFLEVRLDFLPSILASKANPETGQMLGQCKKTQHWAGSFCILPLEALP